MVLCGSGAVHGGGAARGLGGITTHNVRHEEEEEGTPATAGTSDGSVPQRS